MEDTGSLWGRYLRCAAQCPSLLTPLETILFHSQPGDDTNQQSSLLGHRIWDGYKQVTPFRANRAPTLPPSTGPDVARTWS